MVSTSLDFREVSNSEGFDMAGDAVFTRGEMGLQVMTPLVSVIITTYGDCSTLKRAVDSVLSQSYSNIEVIVVDDNGDSSPDRIATEAVMCRYCEDCRVIYLKHHSNLNGSAARNTGIRQASGDYISFLDNDDVMLRCRLSHAVETLEKCCADACFCDVLLQVEGFFSKVVTSSNDLSWKDLLFDSGCMGTGSNLFLRHSAVLENGLFDVSFKRNQDIEYMLRFLLNHKAVWINSLDLVKCDNKTNNNQRFDAYLKTKQHFDAVFADVISMLTASEQVDRNESKWQDLLFQAGKDRDVEACKYCIEKLREYGRYPGRISAALVFLKCRCHGVFSQYALRFARYLRQVRVLQTMSGDSKDEVQRLLLHP